MSDAFDVIPYDDIKGEWTRLGAGSFGNVYKGVYLGLDVAIKEVLPSKDYDVAKYFEREWRLMKECRHPNICLFIGLSRAPDGRVFIVSEFIDSGNVRLYIHDKSKPFPWRLRISFATDVTRALAYLHARKCIHRDLKGENLLVTSNGRIKVTDFGFARIAARNAEESKRLTFCGTDSYMSPEILLGDEFDLPTDIFSLGIIFCEIAARKLADDTHFKRYPPNYTLDADELHKLASPDTPPDFLALCMECLAGDPAARPTTRAILERLRVIEAEVLARPSEPDDVHVGSIKFFTGKRPVAPPRIPSFGLGVGRDIRRNGATSASESSDEELEEAIKRLSDVGVKSDLENTSGREPLLNGHTVRSSNYSQASDYSTTVLRGHPSSHVQASSLASVMTVRPSPEIKNTPTQIAAASPSPPSSPKPPVPTRTLPDAPESQFFDPLGTSSLMSIASNDTYHTAPRSSSEISSAVATEGGSTVKSVGHSSFTAPLVHRFTLLKPGGKPKKTATATGSGSGTVSPTVSHGDIAGLWNPLDLFFSSGVLSSKCDVCNKRIGWKPILECDDCGLRSHVKCGEIAPRNCGLRPIRPDNVHSGFPISKVKASTSNNNNVRGKSHSQSPARR